MTKHMTGTREDWLAARLELLEAEKELTRRSDELARRRQELPWVRVDKAYRFETDEGSASLADLFEGARSFSSTTSCSGPTTRRDVRPARRSPTGSTASPFTWRTTTSRFRRCRGRRWRSCRPTSGGWDGRFPGRPRPAATSISTSTSPSPRSSSARGHRIQLRARRPGAATRPGPGGPVAQFAAMCGTDAPTLPCATGRA